MDLNTNRIVWQQQWPSSCFNGTLATGGGLVFVGRSDGRFTALDNANGNRLWQFQTDAGVAASASTFEYRGHQYVVVLSAGTMFGGGKKGDSLWLFSLDGTIDSLPPEQPDAAAPVTGVALPPGRRAATRAERCTSNSASPAMVNSGTGGHGGGTTLANASSDIQSLANTASTGKNAMPPFRRHAHPGTVARCGALHFDGAVLRTRSSEGVHMPAPKLILVAIKTPDPRVASRHCARRHNWRWPLARGWNFSTRSRHRCTSMRFRSRA